jgi:hypothetical protein
MCTVLLPPGVNPIAINKDIKYQIILNPEFNEWTYSIRALNFYVSNISLWFMLDNEVLRGFQFCLKVSTRD